MKNVEDKSIDLILTDLPYGITANEWDVIIPFDKLWEQYNRIIKDHGCIALFGQDPFSSHLRMSNEGMYRYDWIWVKTKTGGFLNAHKMPLRAHENVSIFYKHLPTYNPQMSLGHKAYVRKGSNTPKHSHNYKVSKKVIDKGRRSYGDRFPTDILQFSNADFKAVHPTQKPVPLLKYLIRTYTNKGDLVLDSTMGSGSTGVAAVDTGRDFIGMELDKHYFEIAKERIHSASQTMSLFDM